MAKKREEKDSKDGDYEFALPAFDEEAFVRREVASAKASFWTIGLGILAGGIATAMWTLMPAGSWKYGWIPLFASLLALRPALQALGFPEDVTKPKALIGSYFMLFFTGLAIWVLGVNLVPVPT